MVRQPVGVADARAVGAGGGDVDVNEAEGLAIDPGQEGSVGQDGPDGGAAAGVHPHQELGAGVGGAVEEVVAGEGAVGQQQHRVVQQRQQLVGVVGFTAVGRAEHGADQGTRSGLAQRHQPQVRVALEDSAPPAAVFAQQCTDAGPVRGQQGA
ncbi:hypothetical protein ACFYYI_42875, partial [Streptomyces sp. NPDC002387]|uniref:hypothetical protein n=1 Tax=Streptomyces sp. NPDC002387 TaxID=3364643 RepID=UPI00369ED269